MKKNILKAIVLLSVAGAATIIIAKLKRHRATASNETGNNDLTGKRIPHGRHSITKRRALEALHNVVN